MAAEPPQFNGIHMATVLAAAIAVFTLGAVHTWAEMDPANKERVHDVGKAWMPHAEHIGPYSGKETVTAVVWLVSWGLLHLALRKRHLDPRPWFGTALFLVLLGVLGIWPPVVHLLAD